jgi:hypothetical protein
MAKTKLPSFAEIANDDKLAAKYFERIRTLKKLHYQVFDLDVSLKPNERRTDFWIGAGAAGISAFVAFLSLLILNLNQVSIERQSAITFGVFVLGNTIIYIVKDRLKEWLKNSLKSILHLRTGKWSGNCRLKSGDIAEGRKEPLEIADMERETWWSRLDESSQFHVWEEFNVVADCENSGARIVKQVWRLPLDEILHTLDSTKHMLRIPGLDGIPREVPVLKQCEFPFQLRVRVKVKDSGKEEEVDLATASGSILTAGDNIVNVRFHKN